MCSWVHVWLKDTEAAVGDAEVPHVDPEVVSRQVRLSIAIDGDGVDMVGVAIGEDASGPHLNHKVGGFQHGHLRQAGRESAVMPSWEDWASMTGICSN